MARVTMASPPPVPTTPLPRPASRSGDSPDPPCEACGRGGDGTIGDDSLEYAGSIQLIVGPMFSGKSTELQRRIRRYRHARLKCMVIKYKKDTRYSDTAMSTHDQTMMASRPCSVLSDIKDRELEGVNVIGIDEGQFFPELTAFCEKNANAGRVVIVAALDGTFQRKAFGTVCDLIPMAESVVKLTAVCKVCASDAAFSKRMSSETAIEVIGGGDLYWPVCRKCYFTAERSRSRAESMASLSEMTSPTSANTPGSKKLPSQSPTTMPATAEDIAVPGAGDGASSPARPTAFRKRVMADPPSTKAAAGSGADVSANNLRGLAGAKETVGFSSGRGL